MKSDLELGNEPRSLTVRLVRGEGFAAELKYDDGSESPAWPGAVELVFRDGDTWPATVSADTATWAVPAVEVGAVGAGSVRLRVGGVTWWLGRVIFV